MCTKMCCNTVQLTVQYSTVRYSCVQRVAVILVLLVLVLVLVQRVAVVLVLLAPMSAQRRTVSPGRKVRGRPPAFNGPSTVSLAG